MWKRGESIRFVRKLLERRSREASHEGPSLLADRLASNAAASSSSGCAARIQRVFSASHRTSNSRRPFSNHTAGRHTQPLPPSHPYQHTRLRGLHHSYGARSHVTTHLMQQAQPARHALAGMAFCISRVRAMHHWRMQPSSQSMFQSAWHQSSSSRASTRVWAHVRLWHGYAVASYSPKLPSWVRSRLPEMPEGWWAETGAWVPRDWALRPSYDTRVAIINAMYACGENVQKLMPVLLTEAVRRDRFAMALTGPPQEVVVDSGRRRHRRGYLAAAAFHIWEISADVLRAVWLFILFMPLAATATLSLNYGIRREEWLVYLRHILRIVWLCILFPPLAATAMPSLSHGIRRQEWLVYLRDVLEAAGPAFIKWGQWAATRHDLFPPDFCAILEHLHTQAPAHSLKFTREEIKQALGASVEELFEEFEEVPVASGSIGQVYKAKLSPKGARNTGIDPGIVVAVKVRHPGVSQAIQRDFALMMRMARIASLVPFIRELRLEDTLAQFAAPLREQVDLALEARHLWQFNYNFRHSRNVRFPYPIYPLVAPEVLVETYEAGEGISSYVADPGRSTFKSRLAQLGSRTMLQMMLVDNLIHSDLHPGNILVALDPPPGPLLSSAAYVVDRFKPFGWKVPSSWREPAIVLLDVGMATHLSPRDQGHMLELFQAFSRLDGRAIGECTLKFSGIKQTCPDPEAFKADLSRYFVEIQKEQEWVETNGADAMSAVLELVRRHKVNMPGHICAVVVTTLVLEGWSSKLDPRHSVLEQVEAIVSPKTSWGQRLGNAVDAIMVDAAPLCDMNL